MSKRRLRCEAIVKKSLDRVWTSTAEFGGRKFSKNLLNSIDSIGTLIIIGPVRMTRKGYPHTTCSHLRATSSDCRWCAARRAPSEHGYSPCQRKPRQTYADGCRPDCWDWCKGSAPTDRSTCGTEKSMRAKQSQAAPAPERGAVTFPRAASRRRLAHHTDWRRSGNWDSGCFPTVRTRQYFLRKRLPRHYEESDQRRPAAPPPRSRVWPAYAIAD